MKYCVFSFLLILAIISISVFSGNLNLTKMESQDFLRLHIRANSDEEIDQSIKYEIKDLVLDYITSKVCYSKTKEDVKKIFEIEKDNLVRLINDYLLKNHFNYTSKIEVRNEYFPTRVYNDILVESGFYDAIIIKLGDANGQNWWCVAYPPLCFYDYSENANHVEYKSRLLQIINLYFNFKK